ncbi:Protein LURP-one-related 6 [Striga hermonthica]|uniref:Protein LURP-one-related 6 n=1 Tax=Striga hermonthica TaxID=68872 RepID=A0A9N7RAW5_STRHE|nr:Protein LURP-one-related 6 [Striga hermonthica]
MAAKQGSANMAVVSKVYCSTCDEILVVRRRPNVTNGGGFVVADDGQRLVFSVDGCGVIGRKHELFVRDGNGNPLLLIRRKQGGIVEALSFTKQWKGFKYDFLGSEKLVFALNEHNSCFTSNNPIRIFVKSKERCDYGYFDVRGDFPGRCCSIVNPKGDAIAQIGVEEEVQQVMRSRDLYHVQIKAGIDQAFIFGVIAVLDYIYDGSTRC